MTLLKDAISAINNRWAGILSNVIIGFLIIPNVENQRIGNANLILDEHVLDFQQS